MIRYINAELLYPIKSILGEGAFWDYKTETLYWVDILDQKIYWYNPRNGINCGLNIGKDVGAVVKTESGMLAYVDEDGLGIINPAHGIIEDEIKPELGNLKVRFNDGKCDPRGTFWAGTMSYDQEGGAGKLYELKKEQADVKINNTTISNGLAWNKQNNKFYFIDSSEYNIVSYDYDIANGFINNRQVIATIDPSAGLPDGMTIDINGYLWVALFNGGKVIRVNPETGKVNFEIIVPAPKVTSCVFGGSNFDILYITTASYQMTEEEMDSYPSAGSLFYAALPFNGFKQNMFKD